MADNRDEIIGWDKIKCPSCNQETWHKTHTKTGSFFVECSECGFSDGAVSYVSLCISVAPRD